MDRSIRSITCLLAHSLTRLLVLLVTCPFVPARSLNMFPIPRWQRRPFCALFPNCEHSFACSHLSSFTLLEDALSDKFNNELRCPWCGKPGEVSGGFAQILISQEV